MKPLTQTVVLMCWVGAAFAEQGQVPQATVDPRPIHLPIFDGTDIRFAHLSSAGTRHLSKVGYILQDNQGFLWFGTQDGLNRFDGYSLKLFMPDPNNENSISGVFISALFKDREGALWIGCQQFVSRLDSKTETFTKYPIPFVHNISQDSAGMLWFATSTGLYRVDPATRQIKHYTHDEHDDFSLSSSNLEFSGEDKEGRFWVAGSEGLDRFDRTNGRVMLHVPLHEPSGGFSFYEDRLGVFWLYHSSPDALAIFDRQTNKLTHFSFDRDNPGGKEVTGISAMLEDPDGNLWLATHGAGVLKFDRDHHKFVSYRHKSSDPESLPHNNVESLFLDREGSVWAGLGRLGLARFNRSSLPFQKFLHLDSADNPVQPFVGAIYEDHKGKLWIGTPTVLNGIDRLDGHYTYLRRTPDPVPSTDVISILEDRLGNLWVGTYSHGLLCLNRRTGRFKTYIHNPADPHSISSNIVPRMLLDHDSNLWVATANGLDRFDPNSDGFTTYVFDPERNPSFLDVVEDRQHALWLGTDAVGLYRFDPATGKFTRYEHDSARPGTLSDNRVNSVHFDHAGTMWVGTQNGLDRFDTSKSTFTVYSQRDGLPGHSVGSILEDEAGDLWMGTNDGVARFTPATGTFQSYSTQDGLPGPDLTGWGAGFRSPSGEMFFGGFSGATAFFPSEGREASYTPPIVFTDFQLSGNHVGFGNHSLLPQSISYTGHLALTHEQNIFSLTFAALSYTNPSTNRYRYRLDGLQTDWSEVGSEERQVTYTTLPPGNYTFRVQGATSRGPWSQPGVALTIRILPAWWATWWFRTMCICAFGIVLWTVYLLRMRQAVAEVQARLDERLAERERIARELHDTLLQGFSGLALRFQAVLKRLPEGQARQMMEKALDRMDDVLLEGRDRVRKLRAEPSASHDLSKLLMSCGEELAQDQPATFCLAVVGRIEALNPLVFEESYRIGRELLINAFQHSKASRIESEIGYEQAAFRLIVRDDGCGMDENILNNGRPGHWGLVGVRERTDTIGGKLSIWSKPGLGTEFELVIPAAIAYQTRTNRSGVKLLKMVRYRGEHDDARQNQSPHSR